MVIFCPGGHGGNRTPVHGFAIRCVTTPPRGLTEKGHKRARLRRQGGNGGISIAAVSATILFRSDRLLAPRSGMMGDHWGYETGRTLAVAVSVAPKSNPMGRVVDIPMPASTRRCRSNDLSQRPGSNYGRAAAIPTHPSEEEIATCLTGDGSTGIGRCWRNSRGPSPTGPSVRAFHAWTLLDNFQWAEGYTERYGLIHTDFHSQKGRIKDSGLWFGRVAATNRLDW